MGNQQTSQVKKNRGARASTGAVAPAIEVTEHNHFHAAGDGKGNPFEKYLYPFENLVFEGAGNRLLAYCGAVQVLEEAGIWKQIRRVAGANSGAVMAALLGVGYSGAELRRHFTNDQKIVFQDGGLGCCGCCGLFSSLRKKYGCNSGKKLNKWVGKRLEKATGTADITFQQVHERFGKEICIAVTNVNQQITEYCHVKTTPTMPVRVAVCMSMATPGTSQPIKFQQHLTKDYYADGALLCSYPIDCFDGWWLSLEKQDGFARCLQPLSDLPRLLDKRSRFANFNEKTMGFVLFSEKHPDPLKTIIEEREGKIIPADEPSSKLSRNVIPRIHARKEAASRHDQFVLATDNFLKNLEEAELSEVNEIELSHLQNLLKRKAAEGSFGDIVALFGANVSAEDICRIVNKSKRRPLTFNKIARFLEKKQKGLHAAFLQSNREDTRNFSSFVDTISNAFHANTRRHFVEKRDLERTVGINTYYIGNENVELEETDINMLLEQGRRATLSYLLYFVTHRHAPLKTEGPRLSFCPDDSLPYYIDDDECPSEIINEDDYTEHFLFTTN